MAKLETNVIPVSRTFDHKAHGRIGIVNMEAAVAYIAIDGKELPVSSIEYLLTFALQNLQDAYAGADSAAEATAGRKSWIACSRGPLGSARPVTAQAR